MLAWCEPPVTSSKASWADAVGARPIAVIEATTTVAMSRVAAQRADCLDRGSAIFSALMSYPIQYRMSL